MTCLEEVQRSSLPPFEKYIIDRQYHIGKMENNGSITPLPLDESQRLLDSNFFSGSLAFSRDNRHTGWLHKLIYLVQRIVALFTRAHNVDLDLCHGMVILQQGIKTASAPCHPFLIAHSAFEGIRTANRDYLSEPDVIELVIYRPREQGVRELYKIYAEKTAFVEDPARRSFFSPTQKARFSIGDMLVSVFQRKRHAIYERQRTNDSITNRISYLVADFMLQNQILNASGKPMAFDCSAYATSVLQGTVLLYGLRSHTMKDITDFMRRSGGDGLDRKRLARTIKQCFLKDNPIDAVAHSLYEVFRQNKLTNYNSQYAMSAFAARMLDKLSQTRATPA